MECDPAAKSSTLTPVLVRLCTFERLRFMQPLNETPAPPPGILIAGHDSEPRGYATWRTSGTRDWLITLTLAGSGRYGYAGGEYHCERGDVLLLAPGTPHDYATASAAPWEFYWAHFLPRHHWTLWLNLPQRAPGFGLLRISDAAAAKRLASAFERLLGDVRGSASYHGELALNALEEVLLHCAGQQPSLHEARLDQRVAATLEWLGAALDQPLDIEALAAAVSLSPSRLAHLFKSQLHESIGQAHTRLRLRHAARLLEFTSRSVGDIARDVGYSSPFHFSHQFKAHYQHSPQIYRARCYRA